jgi:transcriptional regulator with XRE-family HTH domain
MNEMLKELVEQKMHSQGISMREVSRQTGVAHTTVMRALEGRNMDLVTLELFSKWLGVSINDLIKTEYSKSDNTSEKIAMVLERHPKLAEIFKNATDDLEQGLITQADLDEIVSFAVYKLSQPKGGPLNGISRPVQNAYRKADQQGSSG